MEANELKIGSTYLSVKFNVPVKCELSDLMELYILCEGAELNSDIISQVFEPIELTHELIADCRINEEVGEIHNEVFSGKLSVGFGNSKHWSFYIGTEFIRYLDYVHELQYIFQSLTGNELEIK